MRAVLVAALGAAREAVLLAREQPQEGTRERYPEPKLPVRVCGGRTGTAGTKKERKKWKRGGRSAEGLSVTEHLPHPEAETFVRVTRYVVAENFAVFCTTAVSALL